MYMSYQGKHVREEWNGRMRGGLGHHLQSSLLWWRDICLSFYTQLWTQIVGNERKNIINTAEMSFLPRAAALKRTMINLFCLKKNYLVWDKWYYHMLFPWDHSEREDLFTIENFNFISDSKLLSLFKQGHMWSGNKLDRLYKGNKKE